ncbi:hypothetical protein HOF56_04765, partial [Candidatus Peribacteria bacterium]|nr:hypothetical protein [Candidatus Peribacteria bacterium]
KEPKTIRQKASRALGKIGKAVNMETAAVKEELIRLGKEIDVEPSRRTEHAGTDSSDILTS